jgi:hypothetical protein
MPAVLEGLVRAPPVTVRTSGPEDAHRSSPRCHQPRVRRSLQASELLSFFSPELGPFPAWCVPGRLCSSSERR